ncbi:MAG TPA: hypothetical protein VMV29_02505 [Ktedonobacterales bacterium]|nr:hypothetical protein [Ktedonobacterales bacterium]
MTMNPDDEPTQRIPRDRSGNQPVPPPEPTQAEDRFPQQAQPAYLAQDGRAGEPLAQPPQPPGGAPLRPVAGPAPARPRRRRRLTAAVAIVVVVALLLACVAVVFLPRPSALSICAVGEISGQCESGAIRAVGQAQTVRVTVALGGFSLLGGLTRLTIIGANARSVGVSPDSHGAVMYGYTGAHAGTDTITARLAVLGAQLSASVTIRWLTPRHLQHPIIFLHGVNETAAPIAEQLNPNHPADASVEWSALLRSLAIEYDPHYLRAYCYLDDYAWLSNAAGCPAPEAMNCVHVSPINGTTSQSCISQSSIAANALELSQVVSALYLSQPASGRKPVTLIGYSMGAAIIRTMLTICNPTLGEFDALCANIAGKVDQTFFFNGVQQGSWLLEAKHGLDVASLAEQDFPAAGADGAFSALLPSLEQTAFNAINKSIKVDVNDEALTDLTPQSLDELIQNAADANPATFGLKYYSFYSDIRLGLDVSVLGYQLAATQQLPLGDLLLLPQDDQPLLTPRWGGAAFCGACGPLANGYHATGPYHEWALTDVHTVDIAALAPILTAPNAASAFDSVLTSPVQHLNIEKAATQEPGSKIQVHDITGSLGGESDMPSEIVAILLQNDGQASL